jgi:hypothetical protein
VYTPSLYGYFTYQSGISWSECHQAHNIRSSCEAEIKSADEATQDTNYLRNLMNDLHLSDCKTPTPVIYNDNQGYADWSTSTLVKNIRHLNIRENAVREAVHHKEIDLEHTPGIWNPADLFNKEYKDKIRDFTSL